MNSQVSSNSQTPSLKQWYSFDPYHTNIRVNREASIATKQLGVERLNNFHDRNQRTPIFFSEARSSSSQTRIAPQQAMNHSPVADSFTPLPSASSERAAAPKQEENTTVLIDQLTAARIIGIDQLPYHVIVEKFINYDALGYLKPRVTSSEGSCLYDLQAVNTFVSNRQEAMSTYQLKTKKFGHIHGNRMYTQK